MADTFAASMLTRRLSPRMLACPIVAVSLLVAACGTSAVIRADRASRADPRTRQALLHVARVFNADYGANRDGAVYDRWDGAARAVIARAEYIRRHAECPTAPGPAVVESASPAGGGYWQVRYAIGGTQLVDYWHYVHRRWVFDLLRSNPDAVRLYRLPFRDYARAVGCTAR